MKLILLVLDSFWNNHLLSALAYADDIVLLAPSASALRILLASCESKPPWITVQSPQDSTY